MDQIKRLRESGVTFQNYDFGKNWDKIVEILKDDHFMTQFQSELRSHITWRKHGSSLICPCELTESDGYSMRLLDIQNYIQQIHDPRITTDLWMQYEQLIENEQQEEEIAMDHLFMDRLGISWEVNPYWIGHWIIWGTCVFTNTYLSFPIAKILFPNKHWQLVSSSAHTSVVCLEEQSVFDLLYWGLDGRIDNHIFSRLFEFEEPPNRDPSLGGEQAIDMLMC